MGHGQPAQILTWMQHPVGYRTRHDGQIDLASFQALVFNPWTLWQYM
jgi:cytochrome bd-type quinol oxidase subunit 1